MEGSFDEKSLLKVASDHNDDGLSNLKGTVAAVHFIVTNATKYNVDEVSLSQEIQQLGLTKENAEIISRLFRENKDALSTRFAEESYRATRLLGVSWRVDQILATSSSTEGFEPEPLVHLKLTVDTKPQDTVVRPISSFPDGDRIQEIACELSKDKLNVLIHELSQAQNLLDSIDN